MPSRTKKRALSLAEVLVVAAIFAGLMVTLAGLEIMARKVTVQHDHRSEVYRSAWLGIQQICSELRTVLVDPVDPASGQVDYHPFVFDPAGNPLTSPTNGELLHQSETTSILKRADGWLVRRQPSLTPPDRKLAYLGAQGSCHFERRPDRCDLLQVNVLAKFVSKRDSQSLREYQAETSILLPNQR